MEGPDKKVVIGSHKSDQELVERLYSDLVKRGLPVWMVSRDPKPGTSRRQAVFEAIAAASCFLPCLSPDSLEDEFCRTQIFLARAHSKKTLPVLASSQFADPRNELAAAGGRYSHAIKGIEDLYILDLSGRYPVWGDGSYEKNFEKLVHAIRPVPTPAPLNSSLLYVSYNWKDTEFALRMAKDLQMARARVWIDKLSIQAGENWRDAMYAGLREASSVVVCLSPEAAASENVRHEMLFARMRGVPVLPVVSDRIARDSDLMSKLEDSIGNSEEMRFLSDLIWFKPEPDYEALLTNLKHSAGLAAPERAAKQGIFISYRRTDSQATSGRIHEKLVERFGAETVFKDVDNIPPGVPFSEYYKAWLRDKAAIALIIIGTKWVTIAEEEGGPPRLQDPADHVRIEVETALSLGGLRVIPVLVDSAEMPPRKELPESVRGLTDLNASRVRPDPDFGADMKKLIDAIERKD